MLGGNHARNALQVLGLGRDRATARHAVYAGGENLHVAALQHLHAGGVALHAPVAQQRERGRVLGFEALIGLGARRGKAQVSHGESNVVAGGADHSDALHVTQEAQREAVDGAHLACVCAGVGLGRKPHAGRKGHLAVKELCAERRHEAAVKQGPRGDAEVVLGQEDAVLGLRHKRELAGAHGNVDRKAAHNELEIGLLGGIQELRQKRGLGAGALAHHQHVLSPGTGQRQVKRREDALVLNVRHRDAHVTL